MKKIFLLSSIFVLSMASVMCVSCSKEVAKNDGGKPERDISLDKVDIEKKYLAEGFISNDLYRVVIVSPKEAGSGDLEWIKDKAKNRARVSLEQNLRGSDIPFDRNTKAEIINLINSNGELSKKDIDHQRYNVYYFDITKKNMKNYLKNVSSQR